MSMHRALPICLLILVQSWGGRLRLFPATADRWADVSFENLRAQGGFVVSAERKKGETVRVAITATVDQPLRLKNPFGARPYRANLDVRVDDDELQCTLKTGQTLQLRARSSSIRDPE